LKDAEIFNSISFYDDLLRMLAECSGTKENENEQDRGTLFYRMDDYSANLFMFF